MPGHALKHFPGAEALLYMCTETSKPCPKALAWHAHSPNNLPMLPQVKLVEVFGGHNIPNVEFVVGTRDDPSELLVEGVQPVPIFRWAALTEWDAAE